MQIMKPFAKIVTGESTLQQSEAHRRLYASIAIPVHIQWLKRQLHVKYAPRVQLGNIARDVEIILKGVVSPVKLVVLVSISLDALAHLLVNVNHVKSVHLVNIARDVEVLLKGVVNHVSRVQLGNIVRDVEIILKGVVNYAILENILRGEEVIQRVQFVNLENIKINLANQYATIVSRVQKDNTIRDAEVLLKEAVNPVKLVVLASIYLDALAHLLEYVNHVKSVQLVSIARDVKVLLKGVVNHAPRVQLGNIGRDVARGLLKGVVNSATLENILQGKEPRR